MQVIGIELSLKSMAVSTAAQGTPRDQVIEADGYRILRFWNNDVLTNAEGVAILLTAALAETSPHP